MDASAHDHDYDRGHMDIREQRETYGAFLKLSKWGSLAIAVGVLFFTMWFATGQGFIAASIASIILLVAGIWLLKEKRHPHGAH